MAVRLSDLSSITGKKCIFCVFRPFLLPCAEIFSSRGRVHFKGFVSVIGKVDFVEDLGSFVLDGFHFDQMRRILSLAVPADRRKETGDRCK